MMAIPKTFYLYSCLVLGVGVLLVLCFVSYKDKSILGTKDEMEYPVNIVLNDLTNGIAAELKVGINEKVNPGCKQRKPLSSYRPIKRARDYNHSSIVHFAKFMDKNDDTKPLKFLEYMSMLSVYKIMKPKKIWIHSNGYIHGKYWNLTQKWTDTVVEIAPIERKIKFGETKLSHLEHMADYIKLRNVLDYGGVAMDFDVIMINFTKLAEMQRVSECVLVQEGSAIRISFFSCMKGAPYLQAMVNSYYTDYKESWVYNAGAVPTGLLTKNRKDCFNVYVETEICKPNFMDVHATWWKHDKVNWRKKTAAHYYKRYLKPPSEDEKLLNGDSSFNEMLNYIYKL